MPFVVYNYQPGIHCCQYKRLKPIRLGGVDGPIARHARSLPAGAAEKGWELTALALTQLSDLDDSGIKPVVLFDATVDSPPFILLYQLHRICGITHSRQTYLSLELEVLVSHALDSHVEDFKSAFTVPDVQSGRRFREILQLGGGIDGGQWKWETPALNMGAAVVNPSLFKKGGLGH